MSNPFNQSNHHYYYYYHENDGSSTSSNGNDTIIHNALIRNSSDVLDLIQQNHINCRERGRDGNLPLHVAIIYNQTVSMEVIKSLIHSYREGCRIHGKDGLPIHVCVTYSKSIELLEILLSEYPPGVKERDRELNLPIHKAVMSNAPSKMIKKLLYTYPEACKIRNSRYALPLHESLRYDNFKASILLLKAFPQACKIPDFDGLIPLHYAARYMASLDMIKVLVCLYKKATGFKTKLGLTPLHYICISRVNPDIIRFLMESNPSTCFERDIMGNLPFHSLITATAIPQVKDIQCVRLFLHRDPTIVHIPNMLGLRSFDVCRDKFIMRLLFNSDPSHLNSRDGEMYRGLNWKARKVSIRLYCKIRDSFDVDFEVKPDHHHHHHRHSRLFSIIKKLSGYNDVSLSNVPCGMLQHIITYL